MLYDSYYKKISKIADFWKKVFKHIVLISIIFGVILAAVIAFMVTKGMVFDDKSLSDKVEITYGSDLNLNTNALFSDISYEYSLDGGKTWNTAQPTLPGEYKVRAVSKGIFGQERYGRVYSLAITPKEIEVFVVESEVIYGNELSVSADLQYDDVIYCDAFVYEDITKETTKVEPDMSTVKIINKDGEDVTSAYNLVPKSTDLEFLKRDISVVVEDKGTVYNGQALTFDPKFDAYGIVSGTLAKGDRLDAEFYASIINVGSVDNVPELVVRTEDLLDVTVHYNIDVTEGKLSVDYRPLIVESLDAKKEYDAEPLSQPQVAVQGGSLAEGQKINCVSSSTITNAGKTENVVSIEITDAQDNVTIDNYSIIYVFGTLEVAPRAITIKTESYEKVYDGVEFKNTEFEISSGSLVDGHEAVLYESVSLTRAGEIINAVSILIKGEGVTYNLDANYEITEDFGTITILKRPITISSDSGSWIYDGKVHYADIKYEGLVDGQEIRFSEQKSVIDVEDGEIDNDVEVLGIYDVDGNAVIDSYDLIYGTFGTIKIEKRKIDATIQDVEFVYSGNPFTYDSLMITAGDGFAFGDELDLEMNEFTAANQEGEFYENAPVEYYVYSNFRKMNVTDNYEISITAGRLTIHKFKIHVNFIEELKTKEYDGYALELNENDFVLEYPQYPIYIESESLPYLHSFEPVFVGSQTDVGTYDDATLNFAESRVLFNGEVVTENFDITADAVDLVVLPRSLTVTTGSQSWTYDGFAHTNTEYTVEGLIEGHTIKYLDDKVYVTYVADGERENAVYVADIIDENGISVRSNYVQDIAYNYGMLWITPCTVTVETESVEIIYDGKGYRFDDYLVLSGEFADGDVLNLEVNEYRNANEDGYDNEVVEWSVFSSKAGDVTSSYDLAVVPGTVIIEKFEIDVSLNDGNDKTKKYDGTALELTTLDCALKFPQGQYSLPYGHTFNPEFIGSQTEVGIYRGATLDYNNTMVIYDGVENVTTNFEITADVINLLVLPAESITFRPADVESTYNGQPHKATELAKPTADYLSALSELGYTFEYYFVGERTEVTEEGAPASSWVTGIVIERNGVDVTDDFDITYESGNIVVKPQDVFISFVSSKYKYYDGKPLTMINSDCTVSGLPEGHEIDFIFSENSPTDVGFGEAWIDDIEIYYEGASVSLNNFNIYVNGRMDTFETPKEDQIITLEVLQREITVTSANDNKYFNGTPLSNSEFLVYDFLDQKTLDDLRHLGFDVIVQMAESSITEVGVIDNKISSVSVYLNGVLLETGEYNNVWLKTVEGELEVKKSTITIKVGETSKIYDGTPFTPSDAGYELYLNDELITLSLLNAKTGINLSVTLVGDSVTNVKDGVKVVGAEYNLKAGVLNNTYDILVEEGSIKVEPRDLFVTSGSEEWIYDGKSHFNNKAEIDDETYYDFVSLGFNINVVTSGTTITYVGEVDNAISRVEVYNRNGVDEVSEGNVVVNTELGKLKVVPRVITIITDDAIKIFDGEPLVNHSFTVVDDTRVEDESYADLGFIIEPNFTGSQTAPGQSPNSVDGVRVWVNGIDAVEKGCVEVAVQEGFLEVISPERIPINITIFGVKREYNGKRLECNLSYRLSADSGLADGHTLVGIYLDMPEVPDTISPDDLRANNGDNEKAGYITLHIIDENGNDVSPLYYINAQIPKGQNVDTFYIAEITPRYIQLTTGSTTAVFKENAMLTNTNVTITEGSLADGESLEIWGSLSTLYEIGSCPNVLLQSQVRIRDDLGVRVEEYYDVHIVYGTLEFV